MKKVIFICLLSLSMCLSRPDGQPAPPVLGNPADVPTPNPKTQVIPQKPEQTQQTPNSLPSQPDGTQPGKASETPAPKSPNEPQNQTPEPHQTDNAKETPKPADENKTVPEKTVTDASKNNQSTTVNPTPTIISSTEKDQSKTTTASPVTSTTIHSTVKNETVTDKSDVPKHDSTIVQARGFDGASFIGGIILTLGLLAIGFMGFKYYKNQTERNYHTL